jgi:hypothetical protein
MSPLRDTNRSPSGGYIHAKHVLYRRWFCAVNINHSAFRVCRVRLVMSGTAIPSVREFKSKGGLRYGASIECLLYTVSLFGLTKPEDWIERDFLWFFVR